jgi:hypothetical protein
MLLVVITLACTITGAGGVIIGFVLARYLARAEAYAGGITTYEAAALAVGCDLDGWDRQ